MIPPMVRRHRLVASLLTVLAILFAQAAVAAHWCEAMASPAGEPVQVMAHHDCCPEGAVPSGEPGSTGGNLCQAHCQYGAMSVDNVSPVPPAIDAAGPVVMQLVPASDAGTGLARAERFAPAAAPPPPAILFGVLRI